MNHTWIDAVMAAQLIAHLATQDGITLSQEWLALAGRAEKGDVQAADALSGLGNVVRQIVEQYSWVAVDEARPEGDDDCLVLVRRDGSEGVALADYSEEGFQLWNVPNCDVLFWRPLPQLPWGDK